MKMTDVLHEKLKEITSGLAELERTYQRNEIDAIQYIKKHERLDAQMDLVIEFLGVNYD